MTERVLLVTVALIERDGRYFLQRRAANSRRFANLWEFPGGKLEPGETPRQALLRELMEELEWRPEAMEPLPCLEHTYPDLRMNIYPFRCKGEGILHTELPWGWFPMEAFQHLEMPEATRCLAKTLA